MERLVNYEGQIMCKTFLCKFMFCSEGTQFIFIRVSCLCTLSLRINFDFFFNKWASYPVNIYSKLLIVIT